MGAEILSHVALREDPLPLLELLLPHGINKKIKFCFILCNYGMLHMCIILSSLIPWKRVFF